MNPATLPARSEEALLAQPGVAVQANLPGQSEGALQAQSGVKVPANLPCQCEGTPQAMSGRGAPAQTGSQRSCPESVVALAGAALNPLPGQPPAGLPAS